MDPLPVRIGARPLEAFLVAATVVLLCATLAWWVLRRLRTPTARAGGILLLDLVLGFAAVLGAIGAFFELADEIGVDEDLGAFDAAVAQELARSASPATLRCFAWITHLGDSATQWALGLGVALILLARGRRLLALTWIAAVGGNGLLNRLLKAWFQRDRPLHEHGWITADGWSFPSGHASGAVAVYGMLAYLVCRVAPPVWRLPIVLGALLLILLVGYSRVVLQVHYASDVLAGFLSAGAWLIVCIGAAHVVRVHHAYRSALRG